MAKPEFRTTIGRVKMKSNEPTKTKKAMKTMKNFLSMAALALVGAMMTGCSNDDNYQQPENKNNVVTLTTTVSLDGGATTRALTAGGVKTFAVGETMAIYYWKKTGTVHKKAVSAPLTAGDITNGGKSATFTFTLDNPYKDMPVNYVYPAAMANDDFTLNYDALYYNQDGTLATLASNFDYCTRSGAWSGENLPSLTLENQLAILAINLKNSTGASDITGDITDMSISDGTNNYYVSRSAAAGPIYVAILPTSGATINVAAFDGSKDYGKTLATTKTYAAGNGYNVTWNMSEITTITWNSSNIDDLYVSGTGDSYSEEGITLSTNADQIYAEWQDYGDESMDGIRFNTNENSGGFTFTAPTGKYFTNIEMTLLGPGGWDGGNLGTGWTFVEPWDPSDPVIVTWKGTPTNTVGLLTDASHFHGATVKSIVFTVY